MSQPSGRCKFCGGPLVEGAGAGPHWKSLNCGKCRRFNRWLPKPDHLEDHASFVMPFGRHKTKTIAQIHEEDPSYLLWILDEFKHESGVYRKVKRFLDQLQKPRLAIAEPCPEVDPRLDEKVTPWWDDPDHPEPPF
jgi:hypothetical protein